MSGVRGSASGGSPGALNNCRMPGPQKIWPMPAIFLLAGDMVSSMVTELSVEQLLLLLSQISETSSSVGPIPLALAGDSEEGKQFCRMVAGEVVTGPAAVIPV